MSVTKKPLSLLSGAQAAYLKAPTRRINLLYGSVSSGKTWISLVQWALFVASCDPNEGLLMVGRTLTTLKRNCLNLLEELAGERYFRYSLSQKQAELYGRTIWLEGANDERSEAKIRGLTLKGAYVDELTLVPSDFYFMLLSRLRRSGAKLFATTNPDGPEHYVNREIILNDEIDRQAVKFLIDDNCFLEPDYVAAVKKEYSGVFYDRFIRGEFVRAEGLTFPDFAGDPGRWILDRVPEDLRYVTYGVDFGGNKSKTVFIACGIRKGGAGVIVLDAYRVDGDGITPDRVEREFVAFVKRTAARFPSLRQTYAFTDEPQYLCNGLARAVRGAGLPLTVTLAKKEEIKTRIYAKSKLMATGRWAILKGCPLVGYATANQVWDAKKSEDVRLDVEPAVNDVADAEEYSWEAFLSELGATSGRVYT